LPSPWSPFPPIRYSSEMSTSRLGSGPFAQLSPRPLVLPLSPLSDSDIPRYSKSASD
jgi:hypothetical protein